MPQLKQVQLPEFELPGELPITPAVEYERRLAAVLERMREQRLDVLAVYGDREHFANITYLCGLDPRFEEALLLLHSNGDRLLLLGNECQGYLPANAPRLRVKLFQEFSLPGQSRAESQGLERTLIDFGVKRPCRMGAAGWKSYSPLAMSSAGRTFGEQALLDIPAYLADLLRDLAGGRETVTNAASIFNNPASGLRCRVTALEIAQMEYAACYTSEAVKRVVLALAPGKSECEFESLLQGNGLPLTCHRMLSFGEKARQGLSSPSANRARVGDAFTVAFGVWGALNCRAGMIAACIEDLTGELRAFYPAFAAAYFATMIKWYEAVKPGANGGAIFAALQPAGPTRLFDFAVCPGHLIHLDEWVNSPFYAGSEVTLQSGMALQMDIIPVPHGPFCCSNAEDGIVLADRQLQDTIKRAYPACWQRIQRRRDFMRKVIGIGIDDSVLPLSNAPAWLAPYALKPEICFVAE